MESVAELRKGSGPEGALQYLADALVVKVDGCLWKYPIIEEGKQKEWNSQVKRKDGNKSNQNAIYIYSYEIVKE